MLRFYSGKIPMDFGQLAMTTSSETPRILAMHGWQDNLSSLLPILQPLSSSACAFDFRGHGHSDWALGSHYVFPDYLHDVEAVFRYFSSQKVVLMGHSLGALVATAYASVFPEKVAGLILIEGLSPLYERSEAITNRMRSCVLNDRVTKTNRHYFDDLAQMVRWRAKVNRTITQTIHDVVVRNARQENHRWAWRFDPKLALTSPWRFSQEQAKSLCQQVACPVLSLVGDNGFERLRDPQGERLWFRHLTQRTIEGGHHCHLQSPEAAVSHIETFLATLPL